MPRRAAAALAILTILACLPLAQAAEYPLAKTKIVVAWATAGKQSLKVSGRWQGTLAGTSPTLAGATLRVGGGFGEGGTAAITLAAGSWTPLANDRGYKYADAAGAAGGIRTIVLKNGRNGGPGTLKIVGGKTNLVYQHRAAHTRVHASLEIGLDRWCATAAAPRDLNGRLTAQNDLGPTGCPADLVVSPAWLAARLGDPDVQVVDARSSFPGGHVPGALPLRPEHLATTIGGVVLELMPPAQAEPVLGGLGLRRDATVVVYGVAPEYDPARVVWSLRQLGHPDVRYLDGGWNGWVAAGGATTPGSPVAATPTTYTIDAQRDLVVTAAQVLAELGPAPYASPTSQLVDARASSEYVAGHIPTAVFAPWQQDLSGGFLRSRADLEDRYAGLALDPTQPTIAYCLVGWRASVTWLSLTWLGFDTVRNYDGSWTEWGAGGYPVETGA